MRATQRIRIEWGHCDPARIIFNPHYYVWMDQGTHSLLEAAGFPFAALTAEPGFRGCPLVSSGMDFRKPAFLADIVTMTSEVTQFGSRAFTVGHTFSRGETLLAEGREVRVWAVDDADHPSGMRAVPVPAEVRAMLARDGVVDMTP